MELARIMYATDFGITETTQVVREEEKAKFDRELNGMVGMVRAKQQIEELKGLVELVEARPAASHSHVFTCRKPCRLGNEFYPKFTSWPRFWGEREKAAQQYVKRVKRGTGRCACRPRAMWSP